MLPSLRDHSQGSGTELFFLFLVWLRIEVDFRKSGVSRFTTEIKSAFLISKHKGLVSF